MSKQGKGMLIFYGISGGAIVGYFIPSLLYWAVTLRTLDLLQKSEAGNLARFISLVVACSLSAVLGLAASSIEEKR